MLYFY
jgi:hypothetical protein